MSLQPLNSDKTLLSNGQTPIMSSQVPQNHSDTKVSSPAQEYRQRLEKRKQRLSAIRRRHVWLWAGFALAAATSCLIVYFVFISHLIPWIWVILPAFALPAVSSRLAQNAREHDRVQQVVSFYSNGISRLEGDWSGRGSDGEEFRRRDPNHVYATDLDLFGTGSIFELLCTARTAVGRATLADWLLQPAEAGEILSRQEALRELRDNLDMREEWASRGSWAVDRVDPHSLREWANTAPIDFSVISRVLAAVLPISAIVILVLKAFGVAIISQHWFLLVSSVGGLELALAFALWHRTREIATNIVLPSFELSLLGPLLEFIESENFQCPLLRSLQLQLNGRSPRPSKRIRTLAALAWFLRQNELAVFLSPLLSGTNLAIRIEDWRRRNQQELLCWLDALGQMEALLSLARHYYENPSWVFPTICSSAPALFHAESLGHPLIKADIRITYDLSLDGDLNQLVIVSGSNMSGKSTLLRSVGVNAALALAGAPVCAVRLDISAALRIACSISVHDSVQNGRSRFRSEVDRLKQVLDLARSQGTLFLLDEMLGGTNSTDRLYGAKALIDQLVNTGAIGLVTTHDLALTELASNFEGRARNVHFEEHYADGEMRFDYRMRPGVLLRTNGMNVMAALGLVPASKVTEGELFQK